jgi:pimeloyl-ACP methyl ester carboxylesterase
MVIHGIGIGALPYWTMIKALTEEGPVIVAHMPFVSVRYAPICPDIPQTVAAFSEVLEAFQFNGAVVVAHSFGSAVASWLIQYAPKTVKGAVLMDPAVMCIHLRKLLFNFVYAEQSLDGVEGLLRSELYINNCLRRNFYWYTAALFGEDLVSACPSLVVLSEEDSGVPSKEAFQMLQAVREAQGGSGQGETANKFKVLMLEGQGHGGFLSCGDSQQQILLHTKLLYRHVTSGGERAGQGAASDSAGGVPPLASWQWEFMRWKAIKGESDQGSGASCSTPGDPSHPPSSPLASGSSISGSAAAQSCAAVVNVEAPRSSALGPNPDNITKVGCGGVGGGGGGCSGFKHQGLGLKHQGVTQGSALPSASSWWRALRWHTS